MKKIILLLLCAASTVLGAMAQKTLEVNVDNSSNLIDVSDPGTARINIKCSSNIPLTFFSHYGKDTNILKSTMGDGVDSVYALSFVIEGKKEEADRVLSIMSPGYKTIELAIGEELSMGKVINLYLRDPDAVDETVECYRQHRSKGIEHIKSGLYNEAKYELDLAAGCSQAGANQAEIDSLRFLIARLVNIRSEADKSYNELDYRMAAKLYSEELGLSGQADNLSSYAYLQQQRCLELFQNRCNNYAYAAERAYNDHDWLLADSLYALYINSHCSNTRIAEQNRAHIRGILQSKKYHENVLTYEWRKDVPFGLHYGKYKMNKAAGFFQIDFNAKVFEALQSKKLHYIDPKKEKVEFPEFNVAFGWTIRLFHTPVWVHFGPGFTGKLYYGNYKEDNYPFYKDDGEYEDEVTESTLVEGNADYTKTNFIGAVSPVAGLTFHMSFVALRVTYQYRWCWKSELQEFIEPHRVSVGIGIAF